MTKDEFISGSILSGNILVRLWELELWESRSTRRKS
jgi:hypothetical protein